MESHEASCSCGQCGDLKQKQLSIFLQQVGKDKQSPDEINDEDYVELHFHTEHSALDGATRVEDIPKTVLKNGQKAVAITDHGTMSGLYDVYDLCKKKGIKLIPGMESYIVDDATKKHIPKKRRKKTEEEEVEEAKPKDPDGIDCQDGEQLVEIHQNKQAQNLTSPDWESHVTCLARNEQGYRNLLKLHYLGYQHRRTNTFGRVIPRIDLNMLASHKEGLIIGSGCLGSQINQALIRGAEDLAEKLVRDYTSIFGENFYIEMMPIGIITQNDRFEYRNQITKETESLQFMINTRLAKFAEKFKLKVIVTSDAHYAAEEERETHALLLATQSKKDLTDPTCFYFPAPFMMKAKTLAEQFPVEWIRNTKRIADMCAEPKYLEFSKDYKIPQFPIPADADFQEWTKAFKARFS